MLNCNANSLTDMSEAALETTQVRMQKLQDNNRKLRSWKQCCCCEVFSWHLSKKI